MAIQQAAFELFAKRGYRDTTISAIADRADVAPRTVTVHFPAKEKLLFDAEPFTLEGLVSALEARGPRQSALDALQGWMTTTMLALDSAELNEHFWERRALRAQVIAAEPELRGRARAGYHEFERVLANAIAADLGQPGTALVPRLAAVTSVIGLRELYETQEAKALPRPPKAADLAPLVDRVIAFARAGIPSTNTSPPSPRNNRARRSRTG